MISATENQRAAARFEWDPTWFGLEADDYGPALETAIKAYQNTEKLVEDGWAHIRTYRRLLTDKIVAGEVKLAEPTATPGDSILVGEKLLPIPWPRVVTPGEEGALTLRRGFSARRRPPGEVRAAIIHWDVATSAAACHRILNLGGISSHFVIDWDGTIYQMVDLAHTAWHAGHQRINGASIGIDFNNPVRAKYASKLEKLGQKKRKKISGWKINGWTPKPFLAMHEVQVEALVGLLAGLAAHFPNLALDAVKYDKAKTINRQDGLSIPSFSGVYHHAEVDVRKRGKWDTAGVVLGDVCEAARALAA